MHLPISDDLRNFDLGEGSLTSNSNVWIGCSSIESDTTLHLGAVNLLFALQSCTTPLTHPPAKSLPKRSPRDKGQKTLLHVAERAHSLQNKIKMLARSLVIRVLRSSRPLHSPGESTVLDGHATVFHLLARYYFIFF